MQQFEKVVAHYAPWMDEMSRVCIENNQIDPALYQKHNVKRGLRDSSSKECILPSYRLRQK